MGIDLGNDYSLYENNSMCQKLIPSQQLIEKISLRKKELGDISLNEYYKSTKEYHEQRQRINDRNLVLKDDGFDSNLYFNDLTCICPNLIIKDGKYVVNPIVFINAHATDYLDVTIIHELNHVLELNLTCIDDDVCQFSCGWDIVNSSLNESPEVVQKLEDRKEKREYELFNEIINELISQEITAILHSSKNYIFNDEESAKIKGGTSYQYTIHLVKDFYTTYKKEILESRKTRNMQILFDKVGKDNFDKLNELLHEFYEHFGGMKIYSLIGNLNKKLDTELTRKHTELLERRDKILASMKEKKLQFENQK